MRKGNGDGGERGDGKDNEMPAMVISVMVRMMTKTKTPNRRDFALNRRFDFRIPIFDFRLRLQNESTVSH